MPSFSQGSHSNVGNIAHINRAHLRITYRCVKAFWVAIIERKFNKPCIKRLGRRNVYAIPDAWIAASTAAW